MGELVDFPSLGTENLIGLGEDFMRALPFVARDPSRSRMEEEWISSISGAVSRATTSTSLSSQDAVALAETFSHVRSSSTKPRPHLKTYVFVIGPKAHPSERFLYAGPVDKTLYSYPPSWTTHLPRSRTAQKITGIRAPRICRRLEGELSWEPRVRQGNPGTEYHQPGEDQKGA